MKRKAGNVIATIATLSTVIFVALRLLEIINWPWVWVLSPLWVSTLILLIFLIWLLDFT